VRISRRELRPQRGQRLYRSPKLTYLLATNAGKARFFALYGFDPTRPHELADALRWHVRNRHYDSSQQTMHGMKYVVRCSAPSPDGRNPCIRTIWIVDIGQTVPRLVTSYAGP
jgi:hypothetical protein